MEAWDICFLGICRARRGHQDGYLRSKKNRAVLASLLLPARLTFPLPTVPALHSRQTLAERFWGDKTNPRVHLRQTLASLTALFGDECFTTDHDTIRAAPGAFVTDIDRIWAAYHRGCSGPPDERLLHFIEAEGEMNGPFLEGCFQPGDEAEPWLLTRRAEVHSGIGVILFALVDAFEQAGNLNGAMEAARRAVRFQPDSPQAQSLVWRLAQQTGQEAPQVLFEPTTTFEQASERVAANAAVHGTAQLTGEETRLFHVLYQAKLQTLSPQAQKALPRLAVLPAPFSADLAAQVARVPRRMLTALSRTPFLQRSGDGWTLPEAVRVCAWRQVPSSAKQKLEKRFASVCETWAYAATAAAAEPERPFPPPFISVAHAEPFLGAALRWGFNHPVTLEWVDFVSRLRALGLSPLACEAIPFLDYACADDAHPATLRWLAAATAGYVLVDRSEFSAALLRFEQALSFAPLPPERLGEEAGVYFMLANAAHYAGDSRAALSYLHEAELRLQQVGNAHEATGCLRFRAEILNHLGDYEEALRACDKVLVLRRSAEGGGHEPSVADALFWKGATLMRLHRSSEAAACVEEALSIWQETGDGTGTGFCLRLMGRLRAEQGHFAEARAHIEHAILLHERRGDMGSRRAAVEAQADVYLQEGRFEKALPLYEECLAGHEAQKHEKGTLRLRARIQLCQITISQGLPPA